MIIPKYLQYPNMTEEDKSRLEEWIKSKREIMKNAPAYPTEDEAKKGAVEMLKKDDESWPSVWREPRDVGRDYAVVDNPKRETAQISGYIETVDQDTIYDIAKGDVDEIEEV